MVAVSAPRLGVTSDDAQRTRLVRIRELMQTGRPAMGLLAGALFGALVHELGLWSLKGWDHLWVLFAILFAVTAAVTAASNAAVRFARFLVIADVVLLCVLCFVAFTSVMPFLAHRWIRADSLPASVDAVVVLSGDVTSGGALSAAAADRLITGLELVRRGVAPRLFTTRVAYRRYGIFRSSDADQRQLVELAGITDCWIPVTDDVRNTHDEALVVGRRLRQVGAHTIVLVTTPMHTRRACAVFESVGLRVYCVPAVERGEESETRTPLGEKDRLAAFKYYLYERLGWIGYRRRGWIK